MPIDFVGDGGQPTGALRAALPSRRFTRAQHTGHRSVTGSAVLGPMLHAMAYVDLHFHLLPDVNDGPADMDASLELARAAVADGSATVVASPHVRTDLGVTGAGEINARVPELRERGFGVLIAHPERSADASLDGSGGLRAELEAGSLAQLNALSLTGDHGEDARSAAWGLIAEGLIAVVASDAHGPTRPPALGLARRTLLEVGVTRRATASLVGSTPHRLMALGMPSQRAVAA